MKRDGYKHTPTRVAGHQNCSICHPPQKTGRPLEKERVAREIEEQLDERDVQQPKVEG